MLFLPEYGVLLDNMPDSDVLFVDFNEILHCVVPPSTPSSLRGHWSVDGPVVGIADHRNGFRLGDNVAAQWRADRAAARAWGTHAVASVARQQALQYANLHAAHLAAQAGKRKRK